MRAGIAQAGGRAKPEAYAGRRAELEDPLNRYVYHPLAFRLARLLQPTGLSPNAVSVLSGGMICVAAVLYTGVAWPIGALAGFACHLAWHVADGADGDLARLTGRASPIGEFVDGAADYLGHIVMYLLLGAMLDGAFGGWVWTLVVAAGLSRIAQANHAETKRRQYLWRVYGVAWLGSQREAGRRVFAGHGWLSRGAAAMVRAYLALGGWMAPCSAPLDRLIATFAGDEGRQAEARRYIRQASRGSLFLQKLLGSNPRTILLGLTMLAGVPLWYFLVEVVVLNAVLVVSIVHQNTAERRLLADLQQLSA
jgi:phosphatidylglycerophosphate synthase